MSSKEAKSPRPVTRKQSGMMERRGTTMSNGPTGRLFHRKTRKDTIQSAV